MALYRNITTGEIRDIDDALMAAWEANGNPKAQQWESYTPPPPEPPTPPEPPADWEQFVAFVSDCPQLAAAMIAARDNLDPPGEPLTSGISSTLDEARLRQNYGPFRKAWLRILTAAAASGLELPVEVLAGIVAQAQACNLPPEFIAALQPSNAE